MELFSEIKELIVKLLAVDDEQVQENVHLHFDLGADSLGYMNLTMAINKKYSIELDNDDVMELDNVGELVNLVKEKTGT